MLAEPQYAQKKYGLVSQRRRKKKPKLTKYEQVKRAILSEQHVENLDSPTTSSYNYMDHAETSSFRSPSYKRADVQRSRSRTTKQRRKRSKSKSRVVSRSRSKPRYSPGAQNEISASDLQFTFKNAPEMGKSVNDTPSTLKFSKMSNNSSLMSKPRARNKTKKGKKGKKKDFLLINGEKIFFNENTIKSIVNVDRVSRLTNLGSIRFGRPSVSNLLNF